MAFSQEASPNGSVWRARALDRSLEPAATRSMERLERLLAATRELADANEDASFTVAEGAERAGVALNSFYRPRRGGGRVAQDLLPVLQRQGRSAPRPPRRGEPHRRRRAADRPRPHGRPRH